MRLHHPAIIAITCLSLQSCGQTGLPAPSPQVDLYVYGKVKSVETQDSLPDASIKLYEWPAQTELLHTLADEHGKYAMQIIKNGLFRLTYADSGRVAKTVEIDLRAVPDSIWEGGIAMNVDITLFNRQAGMDYAVLDEPIGKAGYDAEAGNMAWDLAYTQAIMEKLKVLLGDAPGTQ